VWLIGVGTVLAASVIFMVAVFVYRLHISHYFYDFDKLMRPELWST